MFYYDGRHYDERVKAYVEDIPFWKEQSDRYGDPILELACGTGRIAITLTEAGHKVTGLEVSQSMLNMARRKAEKIGLSTSWVRADCRSFDLQAKFSLIIFAACAMSHILDQSELQSCLGSVRKHMAPDSRFIVDVHNPSLKILTRDPDKRYPHSVYTDPDGRGEITVTESTAYDCASQVNRVRFHYELPDGGKKTEDMHLRMFYPLELDATLRYNGFRIEHKYGDFKANPFDSRSPRQIVICSLKT